MIENNTVEVKSRFKVFRTKIKHCIKLLFSSKYMLIDLDCEPDGIIYLKTLNVTPEETHKVFSDYLIKSYLTKFSDQKIEELMKEVNSRPLFE